MKPTHRITLGLIAGGMMCAGCTGQPDQLAQPDQTPASHAADTPRQTRQTTMPAGLTAPIEFGPFDANAPNFQLFKPCEEIPAEVYRELGMGEMQVEPFSIDQDQACVFLIADGDLDFKTYAVASDLLREGEAYKGNISIAEGVRFGEVNISLLTYGDELDEDCITSVETNRGRWAIRGTSETDAGGFKDCSSQLDKHLKLVKYVKGEKWK